MAATMDKFRLQEDWRALDGPTESVRRDTDRGQLTFEQFCLGREQTIFDLLN